MKKRILILALALMPALLAGCAGPADAPQADSVVQPAAETAEPDAVLPEALTEEASARLDAMQPVLDSVLRTIGFIDGSPFQPADTEQIWTRLYLMGVNWGGLDTRVTIEGDCAVVPKQVMYEWESAFSEAFNGLPDLSPDIEFMRYDAARKVCLLNLSDMGDASTVVERKESLGNGEYAVSIGVYMGDGEHVGGMDFILVENPFLGGSGSTSLLDADDMAAVESPVYYYTVRSAAAQTNPPA